MHEPTPQQWAREAWAESQLELLVPIAAGLAVAQAVMAFFVLKSYYSLLLWLCLFSVGFAMIRSFIFLYRLSADNRSGLLTSLSGKDMRWLFLPPIASVILYGIIAPNYWLGAFFIFASLPHFVFVLYLARKYAALSPLFEGVSMPKLPAAVRAFARPMLPGPLTLPVRVRLPRLSFESIGLATLSLFQTFKKALPSPSLNSVIPLAE